MLLDHSGPPRVAQLTLAREREENGALVAGHWALSGKSASNFQSTSSRPEQPPPLRNQTFDTTRILTRSRCGFTLIHTHISVAKAPQVSTLRHGRISRVCHLASRLPEYPQSPLSVCKGTFRNHSLRISLVCFIFCPTRYKPKASRTTLI